MIYFMDMFGTAVFAISGALTAAHKKMDLFGMIVVGLVTAVGGGTLRDIMLNQSVFWLSDSLYIIVSASAALLVFFLPQVIARQSGFLLVADAIGLAVFTVIGAAKAESCGASNIVVIIMGISTGAVGGVIRDLICNEIPLILRREIYATACLLGGIVFVILSHIGAQKNLIFFASASTVLLIRLTAIYFHLSLPSVEKNN